MDQRNRSRETEGVVATQVCLRNPGIPNQPPLPWGSHICLFYKTTQDLVELLVSYFKAGLEGNEACVWIVSDPPGTLEATAALREKIPDFDRYIGTGQLEITDAGQWYVTDGSIDADKLLQRWADREERAIRSGYDGLRVTGDARSIDREIWDDLVGYETRADTILGEHRVLALCSYPSEGYGAGEILDVLSNHRHALIHHDGNWVASGTIERDDLLARVERILDDRSFVPSETIRRLRDEMDRRLEEAAAPEGWEDLTRKILRMVPLHIYISDFEKNQMLYSSSYVEKLLGYSPAEFEELDSSSLTSLVHPDDLPSIHRLTQRLRSAEEGETVDAEYRLRRKDGGWIWVQGRSIVFRGTPDGRVTQVLGAVLDITDRKEAESELLASEKKHRTLFETMAQGVFYKKADGTLLSANPSALKMLGMTLDEFLAGDAGGVGWSTIREDGSPLPPEQYPAEAALRTGQEVRNALIGRTNLENGQTCWFHVNAIPQFRDGDSRPYQVMVTLHDITERKQAADLQAVLVREVNHRVTNNLVTIISMLHREQESAAADPAACCEKSLGRLLGRVKGLSAVYQLLSAGGWRPLPITRLCEEVIRGAVDFTSDGERIDVRIDPSPICVDSNQAHHIALIVNELTTNVIKHAFDGQGSGKIDVKVGDSDGELMITYSDDGVGFPLPVLERGSRIGGSGFELIRGIVGKSLRGRMELLNDPGATVRISFRRGTRRST